MTVRNTLLGAAAVLSLTACGGGEPTPAADSDRLHVVASTNVWGSVARAVGGDAVEVRSIIDDPSADPHSFESAPADVAAVAEADLVLGNGGGYDDFLAKLVDDSGKQVKRIDAFELSGKSDNEHVWYDLPTVRKVADKVAEELGGLAADKKDTFTANAKAFGERLDGVEDALGRIKPAKVVVTEPVPAYLLEAAGVEDVTPAEFTEAIEEETDVPVAALSATTDLVATKQVAALINNTQTESTVTGQLVAKAGEVGIPVVGMTETLPEGVPGYVEWMTKQVDELTAALGTK
ncbi:metal ABC transporter solute-binding protein, Zn/Mn family [Saccharothrix coeruleofusca]|uniref:Metal ABC transporter substrate-binding protein n=1 Tax=Saccharothrix coeruleofusca TaxID=33919 RepID=A0A918AI53_9PSEU|nr:zinc ABC transporter substrate-binding protein [Saccharothrix coeruleofusca]MBP2340399.1 zinc/manganese transport system substrate-binding protein [Saccharothrix coeruleofusca]GGP35607.1 metal ABC transporter substrate-binding protein [Saccharothrix coeruleofusca]